MKYINYLLILFVLAGCTTIGKPKVSSVAERCQQANVLITDLSSTSRNYMLPSGETCPKGLIA